MTDPAPRPLPPAWPGWLLTGLAMAFYLATAQRQIWGDGITLQHKLRVGGEQLLYNHALFLPLSRLVQIVASPITTLEPEWAMKVLAALAGGAAVGLTYALARRLLRRADHAAAAAAAMIGMLGQWFHSTATELHSVHGACAAILLLGLVRLLDAETRDRPSTLVLIGVGAALTPGSHVSGVGIGLPLLVVLAQARGARARLIGSAGTGLLVFGAVYAWIMLREGGLGGFTQVHVGKHGAPFDHPERIPGLLLACLAEFGLYAMPALALVPAGLGLLYRSRPGLAWLLAAWLVAWPLTAWPVDDRALGSYYLPTYPVQALLAALALGRAAAAGWGRGAGALLLAASPFVLHCVLDWHTVGLNQESGPLLTAALASAGIAWLVRRPLPTTRGGGATALLPFALAPLALGIALPVMTRYITHDPYRDRVRTVLAAVQAEDGDAWKHSLMVFLATNSPGHHHWLYFYPGALGAAPTAFNPLLVVRPGNEARVAPELAGYRRQIAEALAAGRTVWVAGSLTEAMGAAAAHPRLTAFLGHLAGTYRITPLADGPADLFRLEPRR